MINELQILQTEYSELSRKVTGCEGDVTLLTEPTDVGAPHVEFSDGLYRYIVTERGLELQRRSTPDRREILYWRIYDTTFWMGVAYEFKNRIEGPDVRRIIFPHWLELMRRADISMADRLESDIALILAENPFVDHPPKT